MFDNNKYETDKFKLVFEVAPNGMILSNDKGKITMINSQAEQYFGYNHDELIGQSIEMLIPRSHRKNHILQRRSFLNLPEARQMGVGRDLYALRKDGSKFPAEIGLNILQTSKGIEILAIIIDITERERISQKLKTSEERYHSTLDNMLEGCQILDFNWKYIYINDAAAMHNRRPKEELLGKNYKEMWPGIEKTKVFENIRKCMVNKKNYHMENKFIFPDGRPGWFDLSIQAIPQGVFILSQDVSEKKLAENKIIELNTDLENKVIERTRQLETANKDLESFSYSVSHDLRAPLRSISSFSMKLKENFTDKSNPEINRLINIILENSQKMTHLIDDLLEFSRLGRMKKKYSLIKPEKIIQEVIREINLDSENTNPEFYLSILHPFYGDRSMIKLLFYNLIENAVKFSSKKENPKIEIGSQKKKKEILFYIKDNGAGFDMKYTDKLFEVFQRLHSEKEFKGTGVGLSMVHRILMKHQGNIWAKAQINKGATFYFTFPELEI